jgi:hypothetical protein
MKSGEGDDKKGEERVQQQWQDDGLRGGDR